VPAGSPESQRNETRRGNDDLQSRRERGVGGRALALTRKTEKTCAMEVIVFVNDKDKVEKKLPLNQVVPVNVKYSKSGELGYACGMNMHKGVIVVQ
jgi:plastocyanin domain-containing protein